MLKEKYEQSSNYVYSLFNNFGYIMDPVTQGAFGAIFAQTMSNKKNF